VLRRPLFLADLELRQVEKVVEQRRRAGQEFNCPAESQADPFWAFLRAAGLGLWLHYCACQQ